MNTTTETEMIIMATVYLVHTNGIQHMRTYTSKGKAVEAAEVMRTSAESMTGRNIITVTTQARGKEVYRWESPEMEAVGTVEIQGEEPTDWAPDFSAPSASECYLCGDWNTVAVFVDYVGRTEGLCEAHRDRVEGQTYELPTMTPEEPVEPLAGSETDAESLCTATDDNPDCLHCERVAMDEMDNREMMAEFMRAGKDVQEESTVQNIETVMVIQNIAGTNGMNHYHAPECRDIQREQRKYGQRKGDAFSAAFPSVASILRHEYDDVCEGDASDMVAEANSEYFGVKIMPCLSLPKGELDGRPVEFVNGEWRLGIALDTVEFTEEQISTRTAQETYPKGSHVMVKDDRATRERVGAWSGYVVAHGARPFGKEYARPWWIPTVVIERGDGATRTFMVGDVEPFKSLDEVMSESDPGDAGFVETDSMELADWEKDLIQATETSISTGTTRHSMTSDGKQWESFQHVLNAGDIVRVTGMQGVYEVHCLIPGLPTVYVLGTIGEPFPVSATATYAI